MSVRRPTAIQDRSTVTVEELRKWAGVNTTFFDDRLERILRGVKAKADGYCNNPFTRGSVELPIPDDVETWILQQATRVFNMPEGLVTYQSESNSHTVRRETDYQLTYADLQPYRKIHRIGTRSGGGGCNAC